MAVQPTATGRDADARVPAALRADSAVRARFHVSAGATRLADHFEQGALRLRLPRPHGVTEAVLLNVGGGIAGGDRLDIRFEVGPGAHLVATTQAAEKVYRAEQAPAEVATRLDVAANARLDWLPQETILFDGARLVRRLDVALAVTAELTLLESVVFGRLARGEILRDGLFRDRWRVARAGQLVFADEVRLAGPIAATLDRAAAGGGARAIATLLHLAPNATDRLDAVRASLHDAAGDGGCEAGASAWNGMLIVRFAGPDPQALARATAAAVTTLTRAGLPRTWSC